MLEKPRTMEQRMPQQGSYLDQANKLGDRFPCLNQFFADWYRFAPEKLPRPQVQGPAISRGRVGVLEFVREKQPQFVDLSDPRKLRDYLNGDCPRNSCKNRLFLLEDLDETYLELLGAALSINPNVLADHLFAYHFSQNHTISHRTLPSLTDPTKSFTLRYYELRETDDRRAERQTFGRRTFARASRQIERWQDLPRRPGHGERYVDVVRHNVSFWCDESSSDIEDDRKSQNVWNGKSTCLAPQVFDSL